MPDLGFIHRFVPALPATARPPLLLLHGTGGDETDLLPLGEALAPGAALLSPRGKVLENGMPRFFRRLAEGVFDQEDLKLRTAELAEFVARARAEYNLGRPIALGFSNGANIAASLLLTKPDALAGAILLRAMVPFDPQALPDLKGVRVLLLSGQTDPLMTPQMALRLATIFKYAGADITHHSLPAGHNLTQEDMAIAAQWLEEHA